MQLNEEQTAAVEHPIGSPACLIAGAGSGKCLGPDVPIIMFDGTIKCAKDINDGDLLLGPDGFPRRVFGTTSGVDAMYQVTPVKGDSWICNSAHILSLYVSKKRKKYGNYLEMSVSDYLQTTSFFKRKVVKLWRPPLIEFVHQSVPLNPYFLGLWLGNCNPITQILCSLELDKGKRIPLLYRRNSSEVRWKVLAGLLDANGYYGTEGWNIISKFQPLAEDILWLTRSLGLEAYMTSSETRLKETYFRVSISGDTTAIPTLLSHKRTQLRTQVKHIRVTEFTVTPLGTGRYHGFELDGDGLFLLGDFTVTHNTRVLTERVRWLINKGVTPRKICCVTFTNKAAGELIDRLGLEGKSFDIPKVSTTHSLALSAIRKIPLGFGLQEKVTPLDDYDQIQMVKQILEREVNVKDRGISPAKWTYQFLEKVGFHRSRGLGFSDEYTDEIHEQALIAHAGYHALEPLDIQIWKAYETEKKKNSVVDFDDMLHLVVRRLRTDEAYRATLQQMFDHVLMDEAQDTNSVQWEFVNFLLSPTNKNFYVVGDVSQAIYSFNGAEPKIIKDYSKDWRGNIPTLYRIAKNHRSLPRIVYLANHIQSKMIDSIPLKMLTFRGDADNKGTVELTRASTPYEIAMIIAAEIVKSSKNTDGVLFKDNVILVRSARQVADIESALVRHRIPYQVRGGRGLLQTEEVRDVLSYLRLATNPKDFTALARAVTVPKTGAGNITLEKIRKIANEKFEGNLIKGCTSVDKLSTFVSALENIQKFGEYPVQALDRIIDYMNYKTYVANKYKKELDKIKSKLDNIERFKELVRGLTEDQKMTTEDVVFQLTLDRAREDDKNGMVTISTIHSSKGLEWKRVFLTNVTEGSIPHMFSMGSESELEEEKRLLYVACTRAKDHLTICVPAMEQRGSDVRKVAPSRFLVELGLIDGD